MLGWPWQTTLGPMQQRKAEAQCEVQHRINSRRGVLDLAPWEALPKGLR